MTSRDDRAREIWIKITKYEGTHPDEYAEKRIAANLRAYGEECRYEAEKKFKERLETDVEQASADGYKRGQKDTTEAYEKQARYKNILLKIKAEVSERDYGEWGKRLWALLKDAGINQTCCDNGNFEEPHHCQLQRGQEGER